MGLFGATEIKGLQILFKDNRHIKFRQLPIRHTCLCEVDTNDKNIVVRGWKDYYKNHYSFKGYKNLGAGEATLSFERDIVLNLNNVIDKTQLPIAGGDLKQHRDIARSRFRQIASKPQTATVADKMVTAMIVTLIIFALTLVFVFVKRAL